MISPDDLFISGFERPFVNCVPKLIILPVERDVVTPLKLVSTDAENPPTFFTIGYEDDSNDKTLACDETVL